MRKIPFAGIELTSQRVRGLRGTFELPGRPVTTAKRVISLDIQTVLLNWFLNKKSELKSTKHFSKMYRVRTFRAKSLGELAGYETFQF